MHVLWRYNARFSTTPMSPISVLFWMLMYLVLCNVRAYFKFFVIQLLYFIYFISYIGYQVIFVISLFCDEILWLNISDEDKLFFRVKKQLLSSSLSTVDDFVISIDSTSGGVGFWLGARRARGSHGDTCMFDQWKWMDAYGRAHGTVSGFTAFIPGKPDKWVCLLSAISCARSVK